MTQVTQTQPRPSGHLHSFSPPAYLYPRGFLLCIRARETESGKGGGEWARCSLLTHSVGKSILAPQCMGKNWFEMHVLSCTISDHVTVWETDAGNLPLGT